MHPEPPFKQFVDAAHGTLNELSTQYHNALSAEALEAFCTQRRRELEKLRRVVLHACAGCDPELRITLEGGLGAIVEDVGNLLDRAIADRMRLEELHIRSQADHSLFLTWGKEKEAAGRRFEQLRQNAHATVNDLFRAAGGAASSPAREKIPASLPASEDGEKHVAPSSDPVTPNTSIDAGDSSLAPKTGKKSHGDKLTFIPGGFLYKGRLQNLGGKPLRLLETIATSRWNRADARTLEDRCWEEDERPVSDATMRAHISQARRALAEALRAAGDLPEEKFDPLPVVDQGDGRTAWGLQLP
jgi:hypothetical protein